MDSNQVEGDSVEQRGQRTPRPLKARKLYQVRHHANGGLWSGKCVGHKARLLPRATALRVAKRLRKAGLFITCDPILVNLTPEQAAYLDRRAAKAAGSAA